MRRRFRYAALLSATAMLGAGPAWSQAVDEGTRAAARQLGNTGVDAFQAGDFALAAEKLDKAYQVLRVPSLGLWSARALVKLGRLLEASERYIEVTRLEPTGDVAVQKQAQADAAAELELLSPRLPGIVVKVEGATPAEVTVTVDGVSLAAALIGENKPVNPGKHAVEAQRGNEVQKAEVTVAEGEQGTALLTFGPAKRAAPVPAIGQGVGARAATPASSAPADGSSGSGLRTVGWIGVGVGAAGLAVGGITGFMAIKKRNQIDDDPLCQGDACAPSEKGHVDRLNSLRTLSSVFFIAGGAVAATGIVLVLTSGSSSEAGAAAFVSPTGAGLRGTF